MLRVDHKTLRSLQWRAEVLSPEQCTYINVLQSVTVKIKDACGGRGRKNSCNFIRIITYTNSFTIIWHLNVYFICFIAKILLRKFNCSLNLITRGNSKADIFISRRRVHTESLKFTELFEISRCLRNWKLNIVLKATRRWLLP